MHCLQDALDQLEEQQREDSMRMIETARKDKIAYLIPKEEMELGRLFIETIRVLELVWSGFPDQSEKGPVREEVERRMFWMIDCINLI